MTFQNAPPYCHVLGVRPGSVVCKALSASNPRAQGTLSAQRPPDLVNSSPEHQRVPPDRRIVDGWFVDVALAYLGGLMIGAPAGLAATWLLRYDLALTIVIVLAMFAVLVSLRRRRRRVVN